jgi:DNA-binding response OmpR family regulator
LDPIPKEERPVQAAALSVLTVEDDPQVRADLRLVLEDAGFAVVAQADDDTEAVELAREHQPDVIVLGVGAPDRLLAERDVPVVAVPKPFSSSEVVEAVTGALVEHRERTTRSESLRSIESLVGKLSYATPEPSELEQASWNRGHVWRRVDEGDER